MITSSSSRCIFKIIKSAIHTSHGTLDMDMTMRAREAVEVYASIFNTGGSSCKADSCQEHMRSLRHFWHKTRRRIDLRDR